MTGCVCHPKMFLGSMLSPNQLVTAMGPWLRETKEGMWPRQLPLVEQTICLGWLLSSAPKYNLQALWRKIQQVIGRDVEMHFCYINKDKHIHNKTTRTKAIHLAVDYTTPQNVHKRIANIYSGQAKKSVRDSYVFCARTSLGQHPGGMHQGSQATSSPGTFSSPNRAISDLH